MLVVHTNLSHLSFDSQMEPVVHNSLSDLAPGVYVTSVTLSVDRVFIRESITQLGEPPRDVKVFEGVELICWDEEVTYSNCACFICCLSVFGGFFLCINVFYIFHAGYPDFVLDGEPRSCCCSWKHFSTKKDVYHQIFHSRTGIWDSSEVSHQA